MPSPFATHPDTPPGPKPHLLFRNLPELWGDALGSLFSSSVPLSPFRRILRIGSKDRTPPVVAGELSEAARDRLGKDPTYRPGTLTPYFPA